jgi:alanine-synthesizing transaminase
MFSSRLPADLSANATARAVAALKSRGRRFIDLTESNPTQVGLDYPPDLLAGLGDAAGLSYEPHPLGLGAAREAVAGHLTSRRGLPVSASRIALTASTSEAYSFLFKLFCDPGDAVLAPRPSYPLVEHLTHLESIVPVPYSLEYHGAWRIDIDSLRAAFDKRTRALLVVSPNNPTGSFLHNDDLVVVAELCAGHDVALIGDEVFADFPLDPNPHAVSVLAQTQAITCSLGGLSKSVGLPQAKLGWIAFQGPRNVLDTVIARYEVVADTYLSVSTPVQVALPRLLADGASVRARIQDRVRANLQTLRMQAVDYPSVTVLTCEGGWSAVMQLPAFQSEDALVLQLLNDDGVLVHPGYFFDFPRETFLVVSLLVEPGAFARGASRVLQRAAGAAFKP